jgi:hypothetical protein
MKVLYFLGVFSCFVFCGADEVTEYCQEKCKNVCIPCQDEVKCNQTTQTFCGLDKPDPAFGGVCPPHDLCVKKEFNCKSIPDDFLE